MRKKLNLKFIGNILTNSNFEGNRLFNVVDSPKSIIPDIPTLIIGKKNAINMYPDMNILDWEIADETYWTYSKREKRNKYEENVARFQSESVEKFLKKIKYVFLNVLTATSEDKAEFLSLLDREKNTYIHVANDIIYVYDDIKDVVMGVSLRDISYSGKNPKAIWSVIYRNPHNIIINVKELLSPQTKMLLKGSNYVIPYLFSEN